VSNAVFVAEVLVPALPSFIIGPLWDQFAALLPERTVWIRWGVTGPAPAIGSSSTN
jgi:hypothetical protein